ncbi:MAG: DUF3892 domain-containing protein [Asticcacaulis sp.]|uniref:DUF3892 domain-containing protein n=1 Tax=Asticcacaulis sp. TaxID=1872648 RepID=UPI0025C30739|nr:DUF3892 domain-containing protein [Asticcacaulis sp.]MCA1936852.1 DUF3892 domain-containing protein [Asticcacaulis sp.]
MHNLGKTFFITSVGADGPDDDYRIDWVSDGRTRLPIEKANSFINTGGMMATAHNGYSAPVYIRRHFRSGRYYLTTRPNGRAWDNLGHIALHTGGKKTPPRVRKLAALSAGEMEILCNDRAPSAITNALGSFPPVRESVLSSAPTSNALSGLSELFVGR